MNNNAGSDALLAVAPDSPSVEKEKKPAKEQGERRPADTAADNGADRRTPMGLGGGWVVRRPSGGKVPRRCASFVVRHAGKVDFEVAREPSGTGS